MFSQDLETCLDASQPFQAFSTCKKLNSTNVLEMQKCVCICIYIHSNIMYTYCMYCTHPVMFHYDHPFVSYLIVTMHYHKSIITHYHRLFSIILNDYPLLLIIHLLNHYHPLLFINIYPLSSIVVVYPLLFIIV